MKSQTRIDCQNAVIDFSKYINLHSKGGIFVNCGNMGDPDPKGEYSYLFKNKFELISIDLLPDNNPDFIDDITNSKLPDNFCDCFLIVQVLEHLVNLWELPKQLHRIIKPNGFLIVDCPFMYKFHPEPEFGDYWRLTPQGMELLFKDKFEIIDKYCTDNNTSFLMRNLK